MTEEFVRAQIRAAVERAYSAGVGDAIALATLPEAVGGRSKRSAVQMLVLTEAAEELILPAVEALVQEAMEQGFDGRAAPGEVW